MMRLPSLRLCTSQPMLALLSLALLVHLPGACSHPRLPFLPASEQPDWETALLQLQASLDGPLDQLLDSGPADPRLAVLRGLGVADGWGGGGGDARRGRREELEKRPLGPFPGHPMEALHYQEGGEEEGEAGGKRNEALTSIAGGLQAFSREKGGFGFRFGKK